VTCIAFGVGLFKRLLLNDSEHKLEVTLSAINISVQTVVWPELNFVWKIRTLILQKPRFYKKYGFTKFPILREP
jgi:hypothetical protein